MKFSKSSLTLLAAIIGYGASLASAAEWNHDPASPIGPYHWDDIGVTGSCGTGLVQTPIDIKDAVKADSTLAALSFNYNTIDLKVDNNGHVIEVPYQPGSYLTADANTYELKQFHFHTPSEHTINGASYDMEAHFVHRNVADSSKIAVVGVWLKACQAADNSCKPNAAVERIFANAPELEGAAEVVGATINGKELLPVFGESNVGDSSTPATVGAYYSYGPGSLTTPPCSEGLTWYVAKNTIAVSQATVNKMHAIVGNFHSYEGYPNNNRPVQPTNGRTILERSGR